METSLFSGFSKPKAVQRIRESEAIELLASLRPGARVLEAGRREAAAEPGDAGGGEQGKGGGGLRLPPRQHRGCRGEAGPGAGFLHGRVFSNMGKHTIVGKLYLRMAEESVVK